MKERRAVLVQAICSKITDSTDPALLAKEIAAYLLSENRASEFESILRDVAQHRIDNGDVEATLVSAHVLDDAVLQDVTGLMKDYYPGAKKLRLRQRLDKDLVGGLRLVLPNRQLDLSVRSKLKKFKRLTMAGKE